MKDLFLSVVEISFSTSLVIALVLALSSLLNRRYAAKWKYFIWLVLALRLAVPVSIQLPRQEIVVEVPTRMTAPIAFAVENTVPLPIQPQSPQLPEIAPLDIVAWVWLAGAVIFLSVHLLAYFRYRSKVLKNGVPRKSEELTGLLQSLCRDLNLRGTIPMIVYDKADSPMVLGFFRPILVFPAGEYAGEDLFFVLKHELIHLKRHDVFGKFLLVLANAVHWFNPLVYLMQKEAVVDMELSCDERVIQGTAYADRRAYTETLLSTISRRCQKNTKFSTQFYGGKNIMKKRFQNILNRAKKKNGWLILSIAIVVVIILGTVFGLRAPDPQDPTPVGDDIFFAARDFAVAYASGDLETMELFLDESYSGPKEVHPNPESDSEKAGLMFNGQEDYRQPGDIFNNSGLSPSLFDKTVPLGSTYTVLMRESGRTDGDHLIISLINREDGWKVRDYRFEKGTVASAEMEALFEENGLEYYAYMKIDECPDELKPIVLEARNRIILRSDWVDDDLDGQIKDENGNILETLPHFHDIFPSDWEIPIDESANPGGMELWDASVVASEFATVRFLNDMDAMFHYLSPAWEGMFWDYTFDELPKIKPQDVQGIEREGDISLESKDFPVGSTITTYVYVEEAEDNFLMALVREDDGWKVYDFGFQKGDGFGQPKEEPPMEDIDLENVPESEPAPMPTEDTGKAAH